VWFDAPIGYISATKEWASENNQDWEKYWKDKDRRLLHFIGKDNIVFHCIIFPAMLKAHGEYNLPDNVPANEFLNLEGRKISTSKNWAVWLHEFLVDFPEKQDVLRYTLCANAPETKDNDFTWKDFQARNNSELVAILGNFVNRALVLTHKYFDGVIPPISTKHKVDEEIESQLKSFPRQIEKSLDAFRFREALNIYMELARMGNKYLADTEPWKIKDEEKDRIGTILNLALQIITNLAILGEPFLPQTSGKIFKLLGINMLSWNHAGTSNLLKSGNRINKAELLFEKIEDDAIEFQVNKLKDSDQTNENQETDMIELIPPKAEITYDEFSKMDMRIGQILEAESVPKSNKLLKLKIDTGLDKRIIVSGIAKSYNPKEIIGRKVCILVNLAPRKIMGIESQGMVLMSEDPDGRLAFLQPDKETINGSLIS
jgi:methionyl-tRNA synthetase